MNNFLFFNPTKIIIGDDSIKQLIQILPVNAKVLLIYGMGSIKKNGVYQKILSAIGPKIVYELEGVHPNPTYNQCIAMIKEIKTVEFNFILAVGGGSVIDAAKFISVGVNLESLQNAWEVIEKRLTVTSAVPFGVVLTLPATGSEMNSMAVILNTETKQKLTLKSEKIFPQFSILDPYVMESLSKKQIGYGIIDSYTHVLEQYLTYPNNALVQDEYAEGLLRTFIILGQNLIDGAFDKDSMKNFMWASTNSLNGLIGVGVPQDWSTHWIGHELTAEFGINHAESVGLVMPSLLRKMKDQKINKLSQYGENVFNIKHNNKIVKADEAINKTQLFFNKLGLPKSLSDIGIKEESIKKIANKIENYKFGLGEQKNIFKEEVSEILFSI